MSEKNNSATGLDVDPTSDLAGSKGTLSEERDKNKKENNGSNAAAMIDAGAGGLDSITNFITSVTGNGNNNKSEQNSSAPPPSENKVNPLLIGGIVGTVFIIIIVLILTKNGSAE
jgi:hypothetical protein